MAKKVTKEEKSPLCETCKGFGRVSQTESCGVCEGTGKSK